MNAVSVKNKPSGKRETLGKIFRSRKFGTHLVCLVIFTFHILAVHWNNYWIDFFILNTTITKGLVVGNYTAFLFSIIEIISWILVDDTPWLGKAIVLFTSGILLTTCGACLTIQYLNLGTSLYTKDKSFVITRIGTGYSYWLPILVCLNFIEGICAILLCIYVCLTWD